MIICNVCLTQCISVVKSFSFIISSESLYSNSFTMFSHISVSYLTTCFFLSHKKQHKIQVHLTVISPRSAFLILRDACGHCGCLCRQLINRSEASSCIKTKKRTLQLLSMRIWPRQAVVRRPPVLTRSHRNRTGLPLTVTADSLA